MQEESVLSDAGWWPWVCSLCVAPWWQGCVGAVLGGLSLPCASPGLTVEWAEDGLQEGNRISVPEAVYNQGCVKDVDEGLEVTAGLRASQGARIFSIPWWPPSHL
jgi:hypothetical protein